MKSANCLRCSVRISASASNAPDAAATVSSTITLFDLRAARGSLGLPRSSCIARSVHLRASMLRERYAASAELRFIVTFEAAAAALMREKPNVDFALAALARVLRLPAGSPLVVFAIGRTIGWIGHAIEQYATDQLIRPRAKYVGIAAPQPHS